ncbi:hypothetical protein SPRG_18018, partial [Saprolegnia parasitica CBS 223.65]
MRSHGSDSTTTSRDWTDDPLLRDAFACAPEHYIEIHEPTTNSSRKVATSINSKASFRGHCRDSLLDWYAAGVIFWSHLVNFDTLLVFLVSLGAPSAYYYYMPADSSGVPQHFSANLSWILVTFAVVSPMIMQIRQAFTRRENALDAIAESSRLLVCPL